MMRTAVLRLCGQCAGVPSGDVDQSWPRMSAPSSPPSARKSVVAVDEIASMLIQLLSPGPRARPCGLIARTGLRDHILKYSSEFNCRHDVRRKRRSAMAEVRVSPAHSTRRRCRVLSRFLYNAPRFPPHAQRVRCPAACPVCCQRANALLAGVGMLPAFRLQNRRLEQLPIAEPDALAEDAVWIDIVEPTAQESEATARFYKDVDGLLIHSFFLDDFAETPSIVTVAFVRKQGRLFSLHEEELSTM